MNDDPSKGLVRTKTPPKYLNITGLFLAWHDGQPDFLGVTGLGEAIALFTSQEKLERARAELPFNGTEVKLVTDQEEFLREVPGNIPIVVDPHRSPTGSLLLTLLPRD